MNTTSKGTKCKNDRIRQLTAAERAALDEEATTCAAEVVEAQGPNTTHMVARGLMWRAVTKISDAAANARAWARGRLAPKNLDAAVTASKSYAVLAAKYGADVAREAVMRRVRAAIERKICGAVAGPGPVGFTGPTGDPSRG